MGGGGGSPVPWEATSPREGDTVTAGGAGRRQPASGDGRDISGRPPGSRLGAGGEDRTLTDVSVLRLLPPVPACGQGRHAVVTAPFPFSAIPETFKELFGRASSGPFTQPGCHARRGRRGFGHRPDGVGNSPATGAPPLRLSSDVRPARKTKEPPPWGSGSLTVSGLSKVLVIPSRAPPWRGWPTSWPDRRTRRSVRTGRGTTSPGFGPRRNAGRPGCASRGGTAWPIRYTDLRP